jgi:hypothetical protein
MLEVRCRQAVPYSGRLQHPDLRRGRVRRL